MQKVITVSQCADSARTHNTTQNEKKNCLKLCVEQRLDSRMRSVQAERANSTVALKCRTKTECCKPHSPPSITCAAGVERDECSSVQSKNEKNARKKKDKSETNTCVSCSALTHAHSQESPEKLRIEKWIQNCFRCSVFHLLLCSHVPNTLYTHFGFSSASIFVFFFNTFLFVIFLSSLFTTRSSGCVCRPADICNMSYDTNSARCIRISRHETSKLDFILNSIGSCSNWKFGDGFISA